MVKLTKEHFDEIADKLQDHVSLVNVNQEARINEPYSHAFLNEAGEVVAVGGVAELWPGRGVSWGMFNKHSKKDFVSIVSGLRKYLNEVPIKRVESVVLCDFRAGHRLARALGFKLEALCMAGFDPLGRDCTLYSRVRA